MPVGRLQKHLNKHNGDKAVRPDGHYDGARTRQLSQFRLSLNLIESVPSTNIRQPFTLTKRLE